MDTLNSEVDRKRLNSIASSRFEDLNLVNRPNNSIEQTPDAAEKIKDGTIRRCSAQSR
jgi:hypothetical protein